MRCKRKGLPHNLITTKMRRSRCAHATVLVSVFCLVARVALSRPEVVHVSGHWSLLRRSGGELKMVSQPRPFEAYIGKTNYYFHYSDEKGDWVGTCDGLDYFWVNYYFPIADADKTNASTSHYMGLGEIGRGSYPSNAMPALQSLWLALYWPFHTNEFPTGECPFDLWPKRGVRKYYEMSAEMQICGGVPGLRRVGFYFVVPPPHAYNWLSSALNVVDCTNVSGRAFPTHFQYSDNMQKGSPTNKDDVSIIQQYDFSVDKISVEKKLPSIFPPIFRGKIVGLHDFRPLDKDGPQYRGGYQYIVGGPYPPGMPENGKFVSRNTEGYQFLMADDWKSLHSIGTRGSRKALAIGLLTIGLFIFLSIGFYLLYGVRKLARRREAGTQ
jgi:hypothetical protein